MLQVLVKLEVGARESLPGHDGELVRVDEALRSVVVRQLVNLLFFLLELFIVGKGHLGLGPAARVKLAVICTVHCVIW